MQACEKRQGLHYGTKPGHFETSKIYFPTSKGVSAVSERANEWAQRRARAKRAVRSKRTCERCEQTSEWPSEWPSTAVCIFCCSRPYCKDSILGHSQFRAKGWRLWVIGKKEFVFWSILWMEWGWGEGWLRMKRNVEEVVVRVGLQLVEGGVGMRLCTYVFCWQLSFFRSFYHLVSFICPLFLTILSHVFCLEGGKLETKKTKNRWTQERIGYVRWDEKKVDNSRDSMIVVEKKKRVEERG